MPKLRSLRLAPLALAYWTGLAGSAQRSNDCARILMFHGTPRHLARRFERALCDHHLLPRVSGSLNLLELAKLLHRPMPQPLAPGVLPIFA